MKVGLIEYNAGNSTSVAHALARLGAEVHLSAEPEILSGMDRLIFPGVGHAASAMQHLRERGLDRFIISVKQPLLGICLGQQLLCRQSEEGDTPCLGIFEAEVKRFESQVGLPVPHMGWNNCYATERGSLFASNSPQADYYFVHSYYVEPCADTVALCDYILPFSAALQKGNYYALQFHPEKSAEAGAKLLEAFLNAEL